MDLKEITNVLSDGNRRLCLLKLIYIVPERIVRHLLMEIHIPLLFMEPQFVNKQNYYVFHGRVTQFFANNSSTQCRITMKFLHNLFLTMK